MISEQEFINTVSRIKPDDKLPEDIKDAYQDACLYLYRIFKLLQQNTVIPGADSNAKNSLETTRALEHYLRVIISGKIKMKRRAERRRGRYTKDFSVFTTLPDRPDQVAEEREMRGYIMATYGPDIFDVLTGKLPAHVYGQIAKIPARTLTRKLREIREDIKRRFDV